MANKDNRILGRIGAREVSAEEAKKIAGGFGTETFCTVPNSKNPKGDGDPGECAP